MNFYNPHSIVTDSFTEYRVDIHYKPKGANEWETTGKYFGNIDEAWQWRDVWHESNANTIDSYSASIYRIDGKIYG